MNMTCYEGAVVFMCARGLWRRKVQEYPLTDADVEGDGVWENDIDRKLNQKIERTRKRFNPLSEDAVTECLLMV